MYTVVYGKMQINSMPKKSFARPKLSILICIFVLFIQATSCWGVEDPKILEEKVGPATVLGQPIDLTLKFIDSELGEVTLAELFKRTPAVIITPVYYNCPRLCGLLLDGVKRLIKELRLQMGQDYQVISISFDPSETKELAHKRRAEHYSSLGITDPKILDGWRFLVGSQESINGLMSSLGFNFFQEGSDFVHSAQIIILTYEGVISQYFTGVTFPEWDVRLSLIDATSNKIGSALDHIALFCFRFDQTKGRYTWAAFNVMRVGASLSCLLLFTLLYSLWRKPDKDPNS